ncbi:MAG: hypothetical protein LBT66_07145 [Methanobrevibacter sp.]|jgi:uncharacterized Zn finger protein|nr:hypothetical protein [Candidatus Methanovirga meridionalis]
MECPICNSENIETLKSKVTSSKKNEISEFLLKCNECSNVFKEHTSFKKPKPIRLIISENESSKRTNIDIYPDDNLSVGDILISDLGKSEIKSIELKNSKRVKSTIAKDIDTIWASSIDIPSRIGISVNFKGITQAYKVDLNRDFRVSVDDVVKIESTLFKVRIIKTLKKKMTRGSAKASVIRRVYADPVNYKKYSYDLTNKIAIKKGNKKKIISNHGA